GPAAATVSADRKSDPRRLSQLFRGELDWIVMKALEKDRNRRYETVNAFAADVQRYLHDEPVQACPPTARYRLRKLVRRNKRVLTTAALLGVVLFGAVGAVAATLGWASRDRAARQAEIGQERDAALAQAELWRDRENWSESRSAAQRARGLLMQGGSDQQNRRLSQVMNDLEMAARLEDVSIRRMLKNASGRDQFSLMDEDFYAAFRDYGIDLKEIGTPTAAGRVRNSAIREVLLFALDDWTWTRMRIGVLNGIGLLGTAVTIQDEGARVPPSPLVPSVGDLRASGDEADGSEERKRIRRFAFAQNRVPGAYQFDRKQGEEFAKTPEALELRPQSAILLAYALGESDRAIPILMSAQ